MMNNTMTDQSDVERIVMRRVRLIRILGLIISTAVLATLTSVAALWGIGREVWVARVFENAPADIAHIPSFFSAAFLHTRLIVQVLAVLTFSSLLYLLSEIVRLATNVLFPKVS